MLILKLMPAAHEKKWYKFMFTPVLHQLFFISELRRPVASVLEADFPHSC